jgi:hypothetical protein
LLTAHSIVVMAVVVPRVPRRRRISVRIVGVRAGWIVSVSSVWIVPVRANPLTQTVIIKTTATIPSVPTVIIETPVTLRDHRMRAHKGEGSNSEEQTEEQKAKLRRTHPDIATKNSN